MYRGYDFLTQIKTSDVEAKLLTLKLETKKPLKWVLKT